MTNANEASSTFHVIIVGTDVLPQEVSLHSDKFTVSEAASGEMLLECLRKTPYDAVIAANSTVTNTLYKSIRDLYAFPQRPLLCVFAGETSMNAPQADLVIWVDSAIEQLTNHLEMRRSAAALENECSQLSEKMDELTKELNHEKRMRDEVALLKNAIVRNVSHELKTPLLQVKSAVSLLAEDNQNEKLIEYATGATARLETVIKNITMLSGSLEINPGPVIVREALEFARRNLRRVWEHRDHTQRIISNLQGDLPPIYADKQGLSTVFQLLLDNALKFSEANVSVSAAVDKVENRVLITIEDYGIGIEESHLGSIFETFYQIDPSSTRSYGGTGVGLAIVKLILDNHGSRIKVESKIGKGSRFIFDMPIVKMDES